MSTTFPPGPKGDWLLGNIRRMRQDTLAFWKDVGDTHGDIALVRAGRKENIYFINDPEAIYKIFVTDNKNFTKSLGLERTKPVLGNGLLTSEGAFHKRQRRLMMPAFHRKRIAEYAKIMSSYSHDHTTGWSEGEVIDMNSQMMKLTLKIVGKTLYDTDVSKQAEAVGDTLDRLLSGWWIAMLLPEFLFKMMLKVPVPMLRSFQSAVGEMDEIIYSIIKERRKSGEDRGDLLSMLLQSVDEEDGSGMTDKQARDEALTLFLAGHETTANALTWSWYLLSQHPEIEAKMHQEIDEVLQGRQATMEDLGQLTYTEAVFSEAMRLYPPAWAIGRKTIEPYEVLGYTIPADTTVFVSPYVMHRNPKYYPDPERFDPSRWTPEEKAKRPKFAYFPFGGGQRRCIGEAFAWMEGVLVLASIAQHWKLSLVPDQVVEPLPRITLRTKYGVKMTPHKR